MANGVAVREAEPDDLPAVMNVLDAALLDVEAGPVRDRIEDGDVLVAAEDGRILGALVLDGNRIEAVAVRPRRRGRGIGSALVEVAAGRHDRLVAAFDARAKPFYEGLGFEVDAVGDDRYRGVR